jgi:hypothetical protein
MTSARVTPLGHPVGMVLRLSPDLPILWRTPSSVQFGSEPVVVLDEVSEGEDRLIASLAAGISDTGYAMVARSVGVSPEDADRLLTAVTPALEAPPASAPSSVGVLGDSPLARAIAGILDGVGLLGTPDDAALVVLVADWVVSPADHLTWLSRDVAHLPVVTSERVVTVGPFVEPGLGPCLYCVQLARTDLDPAWPAIATQLWGRAPRELDRLERAEISAFVVRRLQLRLADGPTEATSWRVAQGGEVSATAWGRHPDCRCAVPAGTDWAAVPSDLAETTTAEPTRVPAFAGPV